MYHAKLEKELRCPLEYGLDLFGGKWKSRVICVLSAKAPLRYSALRSEMVNITDAVLAATLKELSAKGIAMLTNALKELETDGLVHREPYSEIPPRVEYSLTEKGQSVVPILQSICQWSGVYYKEAPENALAQCAKCDYRSGAR